MKTIALAILVSMTALSAHAYSPKKGDTAKWAVTGLNADKKVEFSATVLNTLEQYNADDTFTYTALVTLADGTTQTSTESSSGLGELEAARVECVKSGGVEESITVPAGTFKACKFAQMAAEKTTTSWLGDVSFILLKQEVEEKATQKVTRLELVNFTKAP